MIRVVNIVGARPNFMKIAPVHRLMQKRAEFEPLLVHTGQHYDEKMSRIFFDDLELPEPDLYLGIGSGSHAEQTAAVMVELEKTLRDKRPDLVNVVGDVNSTMAASLVAAKMLIPVSHIESGLRSGDRTMPEEINRIVTDALADYLFVTEKSGEVNLLKEGVCRGKIHFVGNVMIDSLVEHLEKAKKSTILEALQIQSKNFVLITLHRPSNVDNRETFIQILNAIEDIQRILPIVFPIHPRTRKMISEFGLDDTIKCMQNLILLDPLGYLDFMFLMSQSRLVLTDSGGIQEETTYLGIPCLTLRQNPERPVTCELGTNRLVGMSTEVIIKSARDFLSGRVKDHQIPPMWDGKASQRIVDILAMFKPAP
jgi:UDP-N-acetylglucosamine 2-epimerase (non-hydrolysing)